MNIYHIILLSNPLILFSNSPRIALSADKFLINKEKVGELFEDIPFLNGGLFDCLDKEDEDGKVVYVDGFSRNPKKQAIIPDYLFFQNQEERVNFSQYGLGVNEPVRGLIEILNNYNFTIDENTPIDQEVALDPELLGKVFENLLIILKQQPQQEKQQEVTILQERLWIIW